MYILFINIYQFFLPLALFIFCSDASFTSFEGSRVC